MRLNITLIAAVAVGALLTSVGNIACARAKASVAPVKSVALFDAFTYRGMDDFYEENPLPDESSYYNPILPGWYSDPSVCTNGEGDYYLVTSTFTYFPGVPVFHSRDLINWEPVGFVLDRMSQLDNLGRQHVSGGIFAPAISYNPANKTYYMITTNVGAGNFFVKATDPAGEWSDPIYLPEIQGIDPAFFFDNDGRAYIVNNDEAPGKPEYSGHRTVRVVEFDTATDKCIGERKIVVDKGCRPEEKPVWCEGPHIYNVDGIYYLMTAEGGTGDWHSEVIYRGPTPFGPFEPWEGNPILTQRTLDPSRKNPITCAGHADLVKTPEGEWWAVFLACRPIDGKFENLGRETFLLPVNWTVDGWPVITRPGEEIPMVGRRPGAKRGKAVTFGNFERVDEFDAPSLSYDWHTLRGTGRTFYSLSDVPGHLSLKCAPVSSTEMAEIAFAGRRVQHHKFECHTDMVFQPSDSNEIAGLLVMKDERHQYLLGRSIENGVNSLSLIKVVPGATEVLAAKPVDADAVVLKVACDGPTYTFLYSTDKGETWDTLISGVDAAHTSTAAAGGFTGTLVGPYASSKR